MKRSVLVAVALTFLTLTGLALAGGTTPTLLSASGVVVKAEKGSLTVQPREESGKFGKNLVLKITGTSKLTVLTRRKLGKKTVDVQNEVQVKELRPNQHVAVIYRGGEKGAVLLSAVALPVPSK
jgi:hypothetical protein